MSNAVQCTIARIRFFCDLTRPDSLIIPLGVIGEIVSSEYRVLGMIGRSGLSDEELSKVGPLSRSQLENVWGFLTREFKDAWNDAKPGGALEFLAQRHQYALRFDGPSPVDIDPSLLTKTASDDADIVGWAMMCTLTTRKSDLSPRLPLPRHVVKPQRVIETSPIDKIAA